MRMGFGFGLLGLLVVTGIVLFWFSQTQIPIAKKGKETQDVARQIAGRDEDGRPATDSITAEGNLKNGKTTALVVKTVVAGGAMEEQYGLKAGDEIVQIGEQSVELFNGDDALAKGQLLEAYKAGKPIVVQRGTEAVTLNAKKSPGGSLGIPLPQ